MPCMGAFGAGLETFLGLSAVVGMKPLGHVRACDASENAWKYTSITCALCETVSTTVIATKVSTGIAVTRKLDVSRASM